MGSQPMYVEAVLTCSGNFYAPDFSNQLFTFWQKFESLFNNDKQPLIVVKVEPWNSIRVWMQLPKEASEQLKKLAGEQTAMLRDLGVLAVHIKEENSVVSINLESQNTAVLCSSTVSQDTASSSLSAVSSMTSLDSRSCKSLQMVENSQEMNILTSQRSNTCRKIQASNKSTFPILAGRKQCHKLETFAEFSPLSFHSKTTAETMSSDEQVVRSRIPESSCSVSETAARAMMKDHLAVSYATPFSGFHHSLVNHSHKLNGVHVHGGRHQGNASFQQKNRSKASLLCEQSVGDSQVLKQSGCLLLPQSKVAVCLGSVTVPNSSKAETHVRGVDPILGLASDSRHSRIYESNVLDKDNSLSVPPPLVVGNCHSTDYNKNTDGSCSASESESGTSISFQSLQQHLNNIRCIINPYTGELENVPDDEHLVVPNCTEAAASNKLHDHACYTTNPANTAGKPPDADLAVLSNGHNVLMNTDCPVSVADFLQSVLAKQPSSQLQASTDRCMDVDHSNPMMSSVGNKSPMAGLVYEHQNVSFDPGVASKRVLNVAAFHSSSKARKLQHSTEISSDNTFYQMNAKHMMQQSTQGVSEMMASQLNAARQLQVTCGTSKVMSSKLNLGHQFQVIQGALGRMNSKVNSGHQIQFAHGTLGTMASQLNSGHQNTVGTLPSRQNALPNVEVAGITVTQTNTRHKFQNGIQDNLGNIFVQVGNVVSAECKLQNATQSILGAVTSELSVGHKVQETKYQLQQVKNTLRHVNHKFEQIADFPSGNTAFENAHHLLQKVPGASSTTASTLTSDDRLQLFLGTSKSTAYQSSAYHGANGLSKNLDAENASSIDLANIQSMITATDSVSGQKNLLSCISGKEGTSSTAITSMSLISEVGLCTSDIGNLLNDSFPCLHQAETSILCCGMFSASLKADELQLPSVQNGPVKKSKSHSQSRRKLSSVARCDQASTLKHSVHGRQARPLTKSQPTVAQLLDEARTKQFISAGALVIPPSVLSTTKANTTTMSPVWETHRNVSWQNQMPNVALINLLPYSQPLSAVQCSVVQMLPMNVTRASSSVSSLIAVPLKNIEMAEQGFGLQSGMAFGKGNPNYHHLSAFVFEQRQGLVQPTGVELLSSADSKQETLKSGTSANLVNVKIESTYQSDSAVMDGTEAPAVDSSDVKGSSISSAMFTMKQEL